MIIDKNNRTSIDYSDVRWSSLIISIQRILVLKKYIKQILNEPSLNNKFWDKLDLVYLFLEPFIKCTNQIQKDNASLYSVWTNFNELIKYYETNELILKYKEWGSCYLSIP